MQSCLHKGNHTGLVTNSSLIILNWIDGQIENCKNEWHHFPKNILHTFMCLFIRVKRIAEMSSENSLHILSTEF